jgi:hypothetical protein
VIWQKGDTMEKLKDNIDKDEIISFIIVFFEGCIIYYQMASKWLTNPDTVWNSLVSRESYGEEIANGRLMQVLLGKFNADLVTPVMTTVLCVIFIALSSIIIGRLFEQKGIVKNVINGSIILYAPCTSSSLTYYYCSLSFITALLVVVVGIYIIRKKSNLINLGSAILLFLISLYLYQAYICIVFTVALMLFILDVLTQKNNLRDSIISCIKLVTSGGGAIILYIITCKLLSIWFEFETKAERGLDFSVALGIGGILLKIKEAYYNFFDYFFMNGLINNQFSNRWFINVLLFLVGIFSVVILLIKNKIYTKPLSLIFLIFSGILLPLAVESIVVMAYKIDSWGTTGILMIPTVAFVYIFVVSLAFRTSEFARYRWLKIITFCLAIVVIYINMLFTNLCINVLQLELNQTFTVANIMLDRIVDEFGYEKGTKLLVSGRMEAGKFEPIYIGLYDKVKGTSASYGYMWNTYSGNENCWIDFYKQYKGVEFSVCEHSEYQEFLNSDIYDSIPLFPEEGSIIKYNDIIVVKLSDVELK